MKLGCLITVACLALVPSLTASEDSTDANWVATNPDLGGLDYRLQGEYASQPVGSSWGLQVVALGQGNFDGVLYSGGLPGNGWNRTAPVKLHGSEVENRLELKNEQYLAKLDGATCQLTGQSGVTVATLNKVHRVSPTMDLPAPVCATKFFSGGLADRLENPKRSEDGNLAAGVLTSIPVGDFQMHIEFRTPFKPNARGQARGNSGVYIQQRYEVQILDSFGLEGVENECGGLYRQRRPQLNMCYPPLAWQTYDIWFRQARWSSDGTKLINAMITVLHNGIPIHWNQEIVAKTGGGKVESPEERPILLQDHQNPVTYRNFWLLPLAPSGSYTHTTSVSALANSGNLNWARDSCPVQQSMIGFNDCDRAATGCGLIGRLVSRIRMRR